MVPLQTIHLLDYPMLEASILEKPSFLKPLIHCYYCEKLGHHINLCRQPTADKKANSSHATFTIFHVALSAI